MPEPHSSRPSPPSPEPLDFAVTRILNNVAQGDDASAGDYFALNDRG